MSTLPAGRERLLRIVVAAALCVPALLFGKVASLPWLGAMLCVAYIAAALLPRPLPLTEGGKILGVMISVIVAVVLTVLLEPTGGGGMAAVQVPMVVMGCGLATLTLSAFRLLIPGPRWGHRGTVGLGLVPIICCGATLSGRAYPAAILAYLPLALWAMHLDDPARPSFREVSNRARLAFAAACIAAAAFAISSAILLPPMQAWGIARLMQVIESSGQRSGFDERFALGSRSSIKHSDEVVMRVVGDNPVYLRGIAYRRYRRGRWYAVDPAPPRPVPVAALEALPEASTELRRVGGDANRWFLPLSLGELALDQRIARLDSGGVLHPAGDTPALRARFTSGARDTLAPAPPDKADLEVPAPLHAPLDGLLSEWTSPAASPSLRMGELQQQFLQRFSYALEHRRATRKDPVVDFLLHRREGHCEYFASALALLARRMGVPARVIGGYMVSERNPLSDYWVVRERHAHAWVEAFIEGRGWVVFDATPPAALARLNPPRSGWLAALGDALRMKLDAFWYGLDGRTLRIFGAIIALLLGAYLVIKRILDARRAAQENGPQVALAEALPCFEALEAALLERGLERSAGETLGHFATRVEEAELRAEAALLRRYAALRYGDFGDESELAAAIEAHLAA